MHNWNAKILYMKALSKTNMYMDVLPAMCEASRWGKATPNRHYMYNPTRNYKN